MGLLDGLIQGAVTGAAGIQKGKAEARELERRNLQDAMARRLMEAQITRAQRAPTAPSPGQPIVLKGKGGKQYSLTRGPDGTMHVEDLPDTDPETQRVPLITGKGGVRIPDVPGAEVQPDEPKEPRQPTAQQGQASAFGATQRDLRPKIEALENKGVRPDTGAELIEGVGNIPVVGGLLKPATSRGANYLRNEEQQQLKSLAGQWMIATLRLDSQGTITPAEFEQYYREYFAQPGDEPALRAQKQAARRLKEQEAQARAGGGEPSGPGAVPPQAGGKTYRPNNPFAPK